MPNNFQCQFVFVNVA